ncbi:MAG: hypothetical protein QMC38_00365 [Sinobacterium sp.]
MHTNNNNKSIVLKKGVLKYSFSDESGCVFLDLHSGETISVLMSETEILTALANEIIMDKDATDNIAIQSLIQKKLLLFSDSKKADV